MTFSKTTLAVSLSLAAAVASAALAVSARRDAANVRRECENYQIYVSPGQSDEDTMAQLRHLGVIKYGDDK